MAIDSFKHLADSTVPTPPITPRSESPFHKPAAIGPISIRKAAEADAPAMAKLGGDTFSATFGHSVSQEDLEEFLTTTYSSENVVSELSDPAKTWLTAKTPDGKVVGIAQLYRGETHPSVGAALHETAEMQRVYVDTSVHGQGVGSKIIAAVETLAREEGFKKLWLTVWEENVKAQKLYQRLGYVKTGEIDFATGACIQTDWVMAKAL